MQKITFEKQTFWNKLKSMIAVDFKRAFTMPLIYIMVGASLIAPILILVMVTMMEGSVSVNPQTGVETVMEGFDNVWQIIGTVSGASANAAPAMDMTAMCNINLVYFAIAVFVCLFVSDDFKSGYSKKLFTVRSCKTDYVISKTLIGMVCGAGMIVAFFIGAFLGGAISGLSFNAGDGVNSSNLLFCFFAKVLLVSIFVPIYLALSVAAKQRTWLSLVCSFGVGSFLFMMIPLITPLNATILNPVLCVVGGTAFSLGLGYVSKIILNKTSLV